MNIRKKGFTLIELMIVLGIVAILVTLAAPSFLDAVRKSRRADAMDAILNIHLLQERWRVNNTTYGSLADLGIATSPMPSADGHYNLTIGNTGATTYTITADALGGQASDLCDDFTLVFNAGVITKSVTDPALAALCWKR